MIEQEIISEINPSLEKNRLLAIGNLEKSLSNPEEIRLREHQRSIFGSTLQFLREGNTAGYILGAPGIGKSAMATLLAEQMDLPTVILSPTQQIHGQIRESGRKLTPELEISDYFAGKKDLSGKVVNTTYQSMEALLGKGNRKKSTKVSEAFDPEKIGLVIADEIHLGLGNVRHTLYRDFPNAILIGMTGTADFASLDWFVEDGLVDKNERWTDMFRKNIHEVTWEEGIERDILSKLHVKLVSTNIRVSTIEMERGDYKKSALDRALNLAGRNAMILGMVAGLDALPDNLNVTPDLKASITEVHNEIKDKRTIIQCLSISQADELADELQKLGITASSFHSKVPRGKRDDILNAHAAGQTQVITGVDMLGVGTDSPPTEAGIFQPTMSGVVKGQWLGRIMRPSPETGKQYAIAVDLVDSFQKRKEQPVLIPYLFDPEYILRGSRSRYSGESSQKTIAETPKITFSGIDIEATVQDMKIQEALTIRFKQASVQEMNTHIDTLLTDIARKNPEASSYELLKEFVRSVPYHMPEEATKNALQAVANLDTNTQKMGKRALLFLHLKTVVGIVDDFPLLRDEEEKEETLFQIIAALHDKLGDLSPNVRISQQVHVFSRDTLTRIIAERYGLPAQIIRKGYFPELVNSVDNAILDGIQHATKKQFDERLKSIAEDTGAEVGEIKSLLENKFISISLNRLSEEEQPRVDDEEVVFNPVMKRSLRNEIDRLVPGYSHFPSYSPLTVREGIVIRSRFGLDTGQTNTLGKIALDIGVQQERVRQIEKKALEKLQWPRYRPLAYYMDNPDIQEDLDKQSPFSLMQFAQEKPQIDMLKAGGVTEVGHYFRYSLRKINKLFPDGYPKKNEIPRAIIQGLRDMYQTVKQTHSYPDHGKKRSMIEHIIKEMEQLPNIYYLLRSLPVKERVAVIQGSDQLDDYTLTPDEKNVLRTMTPLEKSVYEMRGKISLFVNKYEDLEALVAVKKK